MSIATKTGDDGTTALMYGRRIAKTHPRVEAYGTVDELNAALGMVRAHVREPFIAEAIFAIQKQLVTLMGELAVAAEDRERYAADGYDFVGTPKVDTLTAHVTLRRGHHGTDVCRDVAECLKSQYGLDHVTIQPEPPPPDDLVTVRSSKDGEPIRGSLKPT